MRFELLIYAALSPPLPVHGKLTVDFVYRPFLRRQIFELRNETASSLEIGEYGDMWGCWDG